MASNVASWTPREAWLLGALLWDALVVARDADQEGAERVVLFPIEGLDGHWKGPVPFQTRWLTLAPVRRGHAWRDGWRVRVWREADGEDSAVTLEVGEWVALEASEGESLRIAADLSPRFATAEPLPLCEPVPVGDVAFSRHTQQSSANADVDIAQTAGAWMTATRPEAAPWWQVDTGEAHYVETVRAHDVPDGVEITAMLFAYVRLDGEPSAPVEVPLDADGVARFDTIGRFVRLTARRPDRAPVSLSLPGVEIIAAPVTRGTLVDSVTQSMTLFAGRPLFSHIAPNGEVELGPWSSYEQVWNRATAFGLGLDARLEPRDRIAVGIASGGREEWVVADLACIQRGHVVVPLATNDSLDRLRHIATQCDLAAVVCSPDLVEIYVELAKTCPGLELVVEMTPRHDERSASTSAIKMSELEAAGRDADRLPIRRREGDELYTVLYTSGSTGMPKGAMRSYDAFDALVGSYGTTQPCVHHSFQPLSHLSERMMVPTALRGGGSIVFSGGDAARLFEEVAVIRPTAFGGVPRVFDVLRGQYEAALATHRRAHPDQPESDAVAAIMPRFRALFGERLQAVSIGSAKPSDAVLEFIRECFKDCWVAEGYGSTEVGTISIDGVIQPSVDVELIDVPELGYLADGDPPRGEICVRTAHMISGYVGQKKESFAPDGYFRTGDIGERDPDGRIRIIGRRTNVVKLTQGEFVAPEEIEAALKDCALVDQIFVHADPQRSCVVAVVVPNQTALEAHLETIESSEARNDGATEAIRRALRSAGHEARLPSFQIPAAVFLDSEPMTTERGLFTSSNKPNRRAIASHYADVLDALYREVGSVSALDAVGDAAATLVGEVDLSMPLERVGVDSLASVQLVLMLEERLKRPVSMAAWFAASSLEDLARRIEGEGDTIDHQARADLELALPFEHVGGGALASPRNVLLTGATGFLGRGLVESLLRETDVVIHCLVRAPSTESAHARIREHLAAGGVEWKTSWHERVRAVPGDLAAPSLGLEPHQRDRLIDSIDAFFHAGAQVNWITAYSQLRGANVAGTDEIIHMASLRGAALHFVSTISTAPADGDESSFFTEEVALRASGYGVSKWVAEARVRRAAELGLRAAIYRPAMVSGHSTRGHANAGDFGSRYLAGCVALGRHLDSDARLDMTPVDFVADGIVALSQTPTSIGGVHHLVNIEQSMTYRQLGEAMRAAGLDVTGATYDQFRDALVASARGDASNPLAPLLSYFPQAGFALTMGPWPSSRTRDTLAELGVRCPPIDDTLIATTLAALDLLP